MTLTVTTYLVYLLMTVPLTVWVARTLARNGRVFLDDVFTDPDLAAAVNRLLIVGFYLVTLGFVALFLRAAEVRTLQELVEALSVKIGVVLLALGVLHLCNVSALNSIRRRKRAENQQPQQPINPAAPHQAPNQQHWTTPQPQPGIPSTPGR